MTVDVNSRIRSRNRSIDAVEPRLQYLPQTLVAVVISERGVPESSRYFSDASPATVHVPFRQPRTVLIPVSTIFDLAVPQNLYPGKIRMRQPKRQRGREK